MGEASSESEQRSEAGRGEMKCERNFNVNVKIMRNWESNLKCSRSKRLNSSRAGKPNLAQILIDKLRRNSCGAVVYTAK